MDLIFLIIFSILGLIIGSFLNVVILRFNTNKSLGGRSGCMVCQKKLNWYELIPIFSFFALQGRCSGCQTKISIQYPLVELATGVIFGVLFCKFSTLFYADTLMFAFTYAYYAIVFSLLLVITVYDIKHKIIPDLLAFIFGAFAFAGIFFFDNTISSGVFSPHIPTLMQFLGSFIIAIPFALLWLVSGGRWMGLGDAKLAVGLGLLLGFAKVLSGAVLAFWSGATVGLALIATRKLHGMKSEIPFAPFLALGAFIAFVLDLNIFGVF